MGIAFAFLSTPMSAPAASVNSTIARVNSARVLSVSPIRFERQQVQTYRAYE